MFEGETFKIPKDSKDARVRKNVLQRQKLKSKWDKRCKWSDERGWCLHGADFAVDKFSGDEDNFVRLLDEGVVVEGDGTPYAVIGKGVLKKWFDELPNNFSGYINKDHISGLDLGKFSKKELRLVELGNDRYGIDVNVKLDHELYATKDLLRQNNRKALSAEFFYDASEYVKASVATGENFPDWYLIPKIEAVSIEGYAVVDNPKNANSYDENLLEKASNEGRNDMTEDLKAELNEEETKVDASAEENTEVEAPAEKTEPETDVEDTKVEAEAETADDAEKAEDGEETDKVDASIEKIEAKFEALNKEIAEKDALIADLQAKLSAKQAEKESFEAKLGKVLNFASAEEPTAAEGAETTKDETKDDYTVALESAFKEM